MNKFITILGAGRWGTAIASLLADNNHPVLLWCIEPEVAYDINTTHYNRTYCPEFKLSPLITATTDLTEAVSRGKVLCEAIPVKHLRNTVQRIKTIINTSSPWITLSKGIEQETLMFPTEIITDVLGSTTRTATLSGPTFAHELMQKQFSAATLASKDQALLTELQALFNNKYFSLEPSLDPMGTQIGGAIKNVIALMIGLINGKGYKDNATALLLTKALNEIALLSKALGGEEKSVYGLAGFGDLVLTCTGSLSKNLKAGRFLAQGRTLSDLSAEFGTLPEGINTLESIQALAQRHNLSLPLCATTYDIIKHQTPVEAFFIAARHHE